MAMESLQRRVLPVGVDPSLILRVRMEALPTDADWEAADLTVLSVDIDKTLVLFSSDQELTEFRRRLDAYQSGPPLNQINAPYASLFANISEIGVVGPKDRIGSALRSEGFTGEDDFLDEDTYNVDIELWDLGGRNLREDKIAQIRQAVEGQGGEVTDSYTGFSLTLLRVSANGSVIKSLLSVPDIASIDFPPVPDTRTSEILNLTIADIGPVMSPPEDAPSITVIDTGLTAQHPLLAAAIGETIGVPEVLGDGDVNGHGTRVAGVAVYGDVRACADAGFFHPEIWIHSAKIVNDSGRFDDRLLVISQIKEAVEYFFSVHRCRIFNISLGDRRLVYSGGKIGPWAAALDEMAREFDVLIIVSAGNLEYEIPSGESVESHLLRFPNYLLENASRIVEPSNAAIAITVGSIANSAGRPPEDYYGVGMRPISGVDEPSPFTRCGPGVGGSIKPDLCDYGGNLMFDGAIPRVSDDRSETSIVTLNHHYLNNLLATAVGTSYAAPRIAFKAAHLLSRFPQASANLIRALLTASAVVPAAAIECLQPLGKSAVQRVCGHGVPDLVRASTSDDSRVILFADATIELDQFLIFEVPIPEEFRVTRGRRHVQVTLAFDPPVRHTRVDYLGTRMSFRLIRGATLGEVVEFYRKRVISAEGPVPDMPSRNNCQLKPGPNSRDGSTLQRAALVMQNNPLAEYGETYYLVVRCERRWSEESDGPQRFAVVVDLSHAAEIPLYARLEGRIRLRARLRT